MKNKTLKILYDELNKPTIDRNPFITHKYLALFNKFIDRYVPEEKQDDACPMLEELCDVCQKKSFELGFYTAVNLFLKF